MNYSKIYHLLVEKADNRCILPSEYKERHHIIPKNLGGDDSPENLVELFPEEHFIMHQLLIKIYPNNNGLSYCAFRMSNYKKYNYKQYSWLKRNFSKIGHSEETKRKISEGNSGKTRSQVTRKKISKTLMGHCVSIETKQKISETLKGQSIPPDRLQKLIDFWKTNETGRKRLLESNKKNKWHLGHKHSQETKLKMSQTRKGTPIGPQKIIACPHCNKLGGSSSMKRWHFDNCKFKVVARIS